MYGVSKISSEQNIMLTTFPGAQYSAQSLAEHLDVFAKAGIVVDMICQSAPRGSAVDFSFTTSYDNFAAVMKALPAAAAAQIPCGLLPFWAVRKKLGKKLSKSVDREREVWYYT